MIDVYRHPDEDVLNLSQIANVYIRENWSPVVCVEGFREDQCINLLQGPYAKADKQHKTIRPWKIAAGLAAIWIALSMLHVGIDYWKLNRENAALHAEIEQVFRKTFPEVKNVVNARVQMEQRLKELAGNETEKGSGDFLKLLHQSGYELNKDKDTQVNNLLFKNNQLTLDINAKDIQILEAVKTKLQSKDLTAELKSAETVADLIHARMLVSE